MKREDTYILLIGVIIIIMGYFLIVEPTPIKKDVFKEELINSIIDVESNWNPKAKSKQGALGLMQVRYSVWKKELKEQGIITNKNHLFDGAKNIEAGTYILDKYISESKGDIHLALVKYSGGSKKYPFRVYEAYFKRHANKGGTNY